PDTELLERLDEAGLGVARRRRGVVALGLEFGERERLPFLERRQLGARFVGTRVARLVAALLVGGLVAAEGDDRSGCGELGVRALASVGRDRDGRGRPLGVGHLGGDGALPDEVVELELVAAKLRAELGGRAEGVAGWADRLVRLLDRK